MRTKLRGVIYVQAFNLITIHDIKKTNLYKVSSNLIKLRNENDKEKFLQYVGIIDAGFQRKS